MYRKLRSANLIVAFIATIAPFAHVLELISKMTLDGPPWLAIQQTLYRGWGAVFGPLEILAFATSIVLFFLAREQGARRAFLIASACYAAMLLCFFAFDGPVNDALNGWTAHTLPAD